MERGSAKHDPRMDEALTEQLQGQLGPHGSNREEWAAAEPPADDDPPERTDLPAADPGEEIDQDEAEMLRLRHAMEVANDWNPARDRS